VLSIGSLAINPNNPDEIWAGTGEGNPRNSLTGGYGIYKSIDGGENWKCMGLEETRNIHRVLINPQNTDIIYAGAIGSPWGDSENRGVYKTTDGGKTWKKVLYINEKTGPGDLVMDPSNPNKIIAGMWEHRRLPWFFESGGKGSGIYISHDGGGNWKKVTSKDGIPEGNIGRTGLAIAPSDANRVYAWIESSENAIYRSDNGGLQWRKVASENIGNRPFYYADIFVDPKDPDRIYSLYSGVTKSEDGGKTFETFMRSIHPDHHAWYINPDNSDYLIDGNDGGLAISRDRGKSWYHVKSLPLGQFYHISVDMDMPYHVMGGLQDNGSWRGPGYIWQRGGINNMYWDFLMGGDGFDVITDESNNRFGYAMSQGGSLGRFDALTGHTKRIRPTHPEGKKLRFNWNAAIAHDPFDDKTIYYGSQYVHKSTDRGNNWDIISPDLTTNDPEKQKQNKSGGITIDATGAENHCTILTIAPSPIQKDVIWVSTDDGNLYLTTDGGNEWEKLNEKLKDVPVGSWIPQIQASSYNPGEAWVVINNYRRNDFNPYLYYTNNFGKSWELKVDKNQIFGYTLCIKQDPVVPELVFLGTEYGMYFSIDKAQTWTKWTNDFPNVSTMDMVIHPREHDLVIGTFGRAVYVLDDIRPLRQLASEGIKILDKKIHAFEIPDSYMLNFKSAPGYYSPGHGLFNGENRQQGAIITYSIKDVIKKKKEKKSEQQTSEQQTSEQSNRRRPNTQGRGARSQSGNNNIETVKIEIFNIDGEKIRSLEDSPKPGINRTSWGFEEKGYRRLGSAKPQAGGREAGGSRVLPGTYTVKISYAGESSTTKVNVKMDPRIEYSVSDLIAQKELDVKIQGYISVLNDAIDRIKEAQVSISAIEKQIPVKVEDQIADIRKKTKTIQAKLQSILSKVVSERQSRRGGSSNISSELRSVSSGIFGGYEAPGRNLLTNLNRIEKDIIKFLDSYNSFFTTEWPEYKRYINESELSQFTDKNFEKLKIF
ncbi:hypothetical protein ACFLSY_09500, partial [Bacteroidota bacterium]